MHALPTLLRQQAPHDSTHQPPEARHISTWTLSRYNTLYTSAHKHQQHGTAITQARTGLVAPLPPQALRSWRWAHCQYVMGAQRHGRGSIRGQQLVVQQELPGGGAVQGSDLLQRLPGCDGVAAARAGLPIAGLGSGIPEAERH
jgi:hypothetical protein